MHRSKSRGPVSLPWVGRKSPAPKHSRIVTQRNDWNTRRSKLNPQNGALSLATADASHPFVPFHPLQFASADVAASGEPYGVTGGFLRADGVRR